MENLQENKQKNTKKIVFIAVVIAVILVLGFFIYSFTGHVTENIETNNVKIGYLPIVNALPLYLAEEKGYFNSTGINVELVRFDSPNLLTDALAAGKVDFGATGTAAGITAIIDSQKPGLLKVFALVGGGLLFS